MGGMFDPRTLGELLIQLIPRGNIGYWVNSEGELVVVIRDRELANDMLKNINFMRVMLDEEGQKE